MNIKSTHSMNRMETFLTSGKIRLFLVLLIFTILWLLYPQEFIASDPGAYSWRAFLIAQKQGFGNSEIFNHRLGVTVPVAFIYSLLGVNILSTNLWPLVSAWILIITVWASLPDGKSRMVGALLCLTSIPLFESSVALYPDVVATAFMALSSLLLFKRQQLMRGSRWPMLIPLASVSLLFLAFLGKESAYWALPLWAVAFVSDMRTPEQRLLHRRFYLTTLGAGVLLAIAYLTFCHIIWGDALARFKSIQAHTGTHLWSWDKAPPGALLRRLTTAPLSMLADQFGMIILLLASLGCFVAPESVKPWRSYAGFCLLLFWFGSTSFTQYEPMPLVERMDFPLLPSLYILAAYAISRFNMLTEQAKSLNAYLPTLLVIGFAGWPFSQYVQSWQGVELPESTTMTIIKNDMKLHPEKTYLLLCSDSRSASSLSFYFGYRYPQNLRVAYAGEVGNNIQMASENLVFVDRQMSAFLRSAYGYRNYDHEIDALNLQPVYSAGSVELLKIETQDTMKKFLSSINSKVQR